MQNPKFGVTAFTATVLTIICVGKVLLYPYLPPSKSERLVTVDRRKAPPASAVELAWQTDPQNAVNVAIKFRKALLWVIIDPRDSNARDLETLALRDPEIVRLINRYFVPVKLNYDDYPEAERLVFPVSRLQSYLRPGATILATTPPGRLIGMVRPRGAGDRMSTPGVLIQLLEMKRKLDNHVSNPESVLELDRIAVAESERLATLNPSAVLEVGGLRANILESTVQSYGAFNSSGYCELRPSTLDLLLELGDVETVTKNVKTYCASVGYDVIGGGIFDGIELSKPNRTIASKSVLTNAAFAETIAKLFAVQNDPSLALLLQDVLESIAREFVSGGSIFEGRVSDVEVSGLSKSFSLTGSRIDSQLNADSAAWVRKNLLPSPVPDDYIGRFKSLETLADPTLNRVRQKLRPASAIAGQHTREDRAFVIGFVCARLLRIYQLTENQLALDLFRQLEPALNGCFKAGTVFRISRQPSFGQGWLGSYLAVADALLQQYLVFGEQKGLNVAQPILREMLARFGSMQPDWLTTTIDGESPIPGLSGSSPDLSDPSYESTTATAIRVLSHYEPLLQDRELAKVLGERVDLMVSRVGALSAGAQIPASGIVREALSVLRGRRLEVAGPMGKIPAEFPLEFVIPLRAKAPAKGGIYIVKAGTRSGPYTVAEARFKLAER
jgi:hypothetical protein